MACRCPAAAWPRSSSTSRRSSVLGEVCREYGLAGAVQHGASTLPDELFHRFPQVETAEIHLATGFQNALYEHPAFPAELYAEIEAFCFENCADERKAGETDTQFVYKTRKKALGAFKRELWELATKDEIIASQQAKMKFLFEQLGHPGQSRPRRPIRDGARAPQAAAGRPQGLTAHDGRHRLTPRRCRPGPPQRGSLAASSPGLPRVPATGVRMTGALPLGPSDAPSRRPGSRQSRVHG